MMMLRFIAPLILLLGACAPSVRGSSARDALVVEPSQQIEMERGNELYLRRDFSLSDFGLERPDLAGSFWIPAGVDQESSNLATRFSFRNARVPIRWSLELAEVRAHRTTVTRYGRETGEIEYRISPVLRLRVPADAELGVTTVTGEIVARGGDSRRVEIPVRVRAAASR
ncbi:MAG: hypothetical protein WD314_04190 [Trueperaceae bacterium]